MDDELKTYCQPFADKYLTDDQKESFVKERLWDSTRDPEDGKYPIRFISLQQPAIGPLYLLSFMCIGDSKYFKIRGYAPDKHKAIESAKKLAEIDTYFHIILAEEGIWYEVVPQDGIKSRETITLVDQSEILENEGQVKEQIAKEREELQKRVEDLKTKARLQNKVVPEIDLLIYNRIKIYETKKQLDYIQKKYDLMKKRLKCLAGIVNYYEKDTLLKEEWYEHYKQKLAETGSTPLDLEIYTTDETPLEGDLNSLTSQLLDIELEYDGTRPS